MNLWYKRAGAALAAGALAAGLLLPAPSTYASSHREAPLISTDPQADNTDVYFFRSPDRPDTVTLVANYIPLQEPNGGPNFNSFGDDVRYELHVDNNGDARPDVTYRFTFQTKVQNPNTFLYITGPVSSPTDPNFNRQQSYTVERVTASGTEVLGQGNVPPVNVGPRSTPNYDAIAAQAITDLPGGIKAFAGPRDDPFFVDLGSIFDLGGLRPFNPLHLIPLNPDKFGGKGIDGVNGYNTHSIILQVPISQLTRDKMGPEQTKSPTLGVYASASRQRVRVLTNDGRALNSGPWVQVSRLGNPLINEVIIPQGQKDYWNAQPPHRDAQFEQFYLKPELAGIVNLLYTKPSNPNGVLQPVDAANRTDLSLILLQGVPGVNNTGAVKADMLRLNVAAAPLKPVGTGNPLTVIGDPATVELGFPNGRRLEDDVTDIELKAVAQGYGAFLNGAFGLPNKTPNNLVGDGVDKNDKPFLSSFPYLA
ncbi:MAG: DUF4331 domain-containing protein, partial [Chloroflexaceae bacterium]|nr:DUF4331 domain-containing protein [Chloroflexaceae bacterium]